MNQFFNKFLSIIPGNFILTLEDIEQLKKNCEDNNIELIKSIFSTKKIRPFSLPCEKIFSTIFNHGYLELAEYLLNSTDTKEFQKVMLDNPLIFACLQYNKKGTEVAKYILGSPKLREKLDMNKLNEHVLAASCMSMNLSIIEFVLNDNELRSYIDIHHNDDEIFKHCFFCEEIDFLHYLIFDAKITKTKEIDKFLNNENRLKDSKSELEYVNQMFDIREINKDLNRELNNDKNNSNYRKVKI